jgi:hypothetical protein
LYLANLWQKDWTPAETNFNERQLEAALEVEKLSGS